MAAEPHLPRVCRASMSDPSRDKCWAPDALKLWPVSRNVPSELAAGWPVRAAASVITLAHALLVGGWPADVGKRGSVSSGFPSWKRLGKTFLRMMIWSHKAWAGQSGRGRPDPQTQGCDLETPIARASVLLEGKRRLPTSSVP